MFTEFPFNAVPFYLCRLTVTFLEHYQHQLLTPQSLEQYTDFINPLLGTWALYVNVSYAHVRREQNREPLIKSIIHNKWMWDLWNYSINTPLVGSHWGMLTTLSSPCPWCPRWWCQAVDRFWKNRMAGSPGHRVQLQAEVYPLYIWPEFGLLCPHLWTHWVQFSIFLLLLILIITICLITVRL